MIDKVYTEGEDKSFRLQRKSLGRYLISDKLVGKIALWLLVLLSFGYPITAAVATLTKIPTTPVNIAARGLYVLMSLCLLGLCFFKRRSYEFRWYNSLIIIFWVCYTIRLVYDIEFIHLEEKYLPSSSIYLFAFGNCMLPAFTMMVASKYIDLTKLENIVLGVLILSNMLIIILLGMQVGISLELFIIRNVIHGANYNSAINEITLSFTGCQLFVLALNLLLFKSKSYSILMRIVLVLCLLMGLFNLFAGGSRSPMILLVLITFYTVGFYFYKFHRYHRFFYNFKVFIIFCFLTIIGLFAANRLKNVDFTLINRLTQTASERQKGDKEERDFMQEAALEGFYSNPILGQQYLNSFNNMYPHNILIEVLMALGIVGAVLFFPFIGALCFKIFKISFDCPTIFSFSTLVWLSLLVTLFSGALWNSIDFWVLSIFWINLDNIQLQKIIKNI